MTATKVISDRFKVSSLLAGRLKEHQVSVPAVLRRAGLPAGFFQLAHHYLRHSTVELNEAAFLLGYGDSNSFFRAFQGWEGTSPGEWRTRHRMAEAVA